MLLRIVLIALAVYAVVWFLRGARRDDAPRASGAKAAPKVTDMVQCAHCGVHLPRDEALPGRGGVYCGEAHRAAGERGDRA